MRQFLHVFFSYSSVIFSICFSNKRLMIKTRLHFRMKLYIHDVVLAYRAVKGADPSYPQATIKLHGGGMKSR